MKVSVYHTRIKLISKDECHAHCCRKSINKYFNSICKRLNKDTAFWVRYIINTINTELIQVTVGHVLPAYVWKSDNCWYIHMWRFCQTEPWVSYCQASPTVTFVQFSFYKLSWATTKLPFIYPILVPRAENLKSKNKLQAIMARAGVFF